MVEVKTFIGTEPDGDLDNQINDFLSVTMAQIVDVKFSAFCADGYVGTAAMLVFDRTSGADYGKLKR